MSRQLTSDRFGDGIKRALAAAGWTEQLVTHADPADEQANRARGEPDEPDEPDELAQVRYVSYDYWNELSGDTRLASDAAVRIRAGRQAYGVPNDRFLAAARSVTGGAVFPQLNRWAR